MQERGLSSLRDWPQFHDIDPSVSGQGAIVDVHSNDAADDQVMV